MLPLSWADTISTQKQSGCKKGAALFKMASVKVVKSKGLPRNGCDSIG